MNRSLALFLTATALILPGCRSLSPRARAARREQAQLEEIAKIPDPQKQLRQASRVVVEASAGGNVAILQAVLVRYPAMLNEPYWPNVKMQAVTSARRNRHEQIIRILQAAELARTPRIPAAAAAQPQAKPAPAAAPAIQSDVDSPSFQKSSRDHDFALVVGVEKYSNLPDAKFAERDAEAVKRHFLALGIPERNIVSLTGMRATRGALQGYLAEWLPRNTSPDSNVFFYYSGHGAPDPQDGQAYLVPWDGDAKFLQSTAVPLKQLYAELGKLDVNSVVVALDSCFSGAGGRSVLAEGARPLVSKVDEDTDAQGKLTVLSAASSDEITGTLDKQGHGLFTYYFLKGLGGKARDGSGAVTAKSLYDYLSPKVRDEAHRQNREQTPKLMGAQVDQVLANF
jgi:hypothetical protein